MKARWITPDGDRVVEVSKWKTKKYGRPPRWRVIVADRNGNTKNWWMDQLREAK